jgi:S-DNA-T family DNA segregation ATPase FtsK/SpoIIIE
LSLKTLFRPAPGNTPESKARLTALLCSLGLGLTGILLAASIGSALFGLGNAAAGPGYFFVGSYGVLAFAVPAYLFCAAFLLADPRYRPDRIFILAGITVPFITLGFGLYVVRNFDALAAVYPFFMKARRAGIGFLVVIITVMESLLMIFLKNLLFPFPAGNSGGRAPAGKKTAKRNRVILLPPPKFRNRDLKEIYTESAASSEADFDIPPPGTQNPAGKRDERADGALDEFDEPAPDTSDEPAEVVPDIAGEAEGEGAAAENDDVEQALAAAENDDGVEQALAAAGNDDVEQALAAAVAEAREAAVRHGSQPRQTDTIRKKWQGPYFVPAEGLLNQYPDGEYWIIDEATRNAAITLKETLKEFKIQAEVTGIKKGPVITMFEILPAPGVKLRRIVDLQDNIALRLAASSVRIVAPIPGKHAVGIEVPNARRNIVSFREIIEGEFSREGKKTGLGIPVVLGKDITGEAVTADLVQMPHLLIAGATGSGKSVSVNAMILSILFRLPPAECRLMLIDPKIVELKLYNGIPHLLTPVITEPKKAFQALQYCIYEMERRYACLDSMGVRDIRSYNRKIREKDIAAEYMPYIVVVIDEFADLMATTGKELESTVARLAAMSRAVGIHLVLATQRPSIDVITGLIKANIPSRIAFMVAGKMDSRIIIDTVGAEKLLGKGDMLYSGATEPFPIRMQGAFVSEEEVERVVDYVKSLGEPDYIDDEIFFDDEDEDASPSLFTDGEDPLYEKALEIVMQQGKASASYIQRRLKIGYNRAARLVEEMEQRGVVGPAQGSKPRELLHMV